MTEVVQVSKGSKDCGMHGATPLASHSVEGETESHADIQGPSWEPGTSALALESSMSRHNPPEPPPLCLLEEHRS